MAKMVQNMAETWPKWSKTWPKHRQIGPKNGQNGPNHGQNDPKHGHRTTKRDFFPTTFPKDVQGGRMSCGAEFQTMLIVL